MTHPISPELARSLQFTILAMDSALDRAEAALQEIRARRAAKRGDPLPSQILLGRVGELENALDEISRG